jgi:hypothetical protein
MIKLLKLFVLKPEQQELRSSKKWKRIEKQDEPFSFYLKFRNPVNPLCLLKCKKSIYCHLWRVINFQFCDVGKRTAGGVFSLTNLFFLD